MHVQGGTLRDCVEREETRNSKRATHLNEGLATATMSTDKRPFSGMYPHVAREVAAARKGLSAVVLFAYVDMGRLVLGLVLVTGFLHRRSRIADGPWTKRRRRYGGLWLPRQMVRGHSICNGGYRRRRSGVRESVGHDRRGARRRGLGRGMHMVGFGFELRGKVLEQHVTQFRKLAMDAWRACGGNLAVIAVYGWCWVLLPVSSDTVLVILVVGFALVGVEVVRAIRTPLAVLAGTVRGFASGEGVKGRCCPSGPPLLLDERSLTLAGKEGVLGCQSALVLGLGMGCLEDGGETRYGDVGGPWIVLDVDRVVVEVGLSLLCGGREERDGGGGRVLVEESGDLALEQLDGIVAV